MNTEEKDAYLHLLYRTLVEIRAISVSSFAWYNPFTWRNNKKYLYQIKRLTNAFHNLPYDLKTNSDVSFDDKAFWQLLNQYDEKFHLNNQYYDLYKKVTSGIKGKYLD